MTESVEAKEQKKICELITHNPGSTRKKIAEILCVNDSIIDRHLHDLENKKDIYCVEQDGEKRYFLSPHHFGILDKRLFQTRKRILNLITENPGLHLSKIAELLGVRLSLVEYHLQMMEKGNIVTSVKDVGYYKRFYLVGATVGEQERTIVSLLREDIPLRIVLYLVTHTSAKHKDILKTLKITPSTLSYHLTKLVKYDIITLPDVVEQSGYCLKNRDEILRILKKYRLLSLTKDFSDMWGDLGFE